MTRVDDLADADDQPPLMMLRDPAHRVDRRTVGYWRCLVVLGAAALAAAAGGLAVVLVTAGAPSGLVVGVTTAVGVAVLVGTVPAAVALPRWWYRVHRWEVTPTAIYVRRGWLRTVWAVVPAARLQSVDTVADPIAHRFGVAHVVVRTAGGRRFVIRGVGTDTALRISDGLVDIAWADGAGDGS